MIPLIYGNKFDQGFYQGLCSQNANFNCRNQIPHTFIIPFNYPFETIPQVFIILDHIDVYVKTDFRIQIQDATISNFTLLVVCLTGQATCVTIKWYAIDDQRFQIISAFNTINFTEMTYKHRNKNVNQGFITLISHNFDEINFNLSISKITSENVTVSLTKVPEDFQQQVQVGFQIILGPKEAFQNFDCYDSTNNYSKNSIEEKQNAWFITPFTGMGYPNANAVRLHKIYEFLGNSLLQYILKTWDFSFPPCTHCHGFLSYVLTTKFYSLNLDQLEVKQKSQLGSATSISVHFLENNQMLNTTGEFNVTLEEDLTNIRIDINVVCPLGKWIESNFEKCLDCPIQKLYKQNYKCSNTLKELVFKIQYSKQAQAYSELLINISENLCDMKQILYNQKLEEIIMFSINLKDI
ncbi:unnamed protein product [Paramecium primaurelia]|uniref:H-type lectin domain-containing protein n=1 Tax=Paramecium primaurelia TaxID=5886 RepID=A0A8S1QZA2_PARPR|nr:unnamed protein product [Paramecium primaurelia]CAD8119809.1 unnamed protein product [Paramecium primaurelia]CAD8119810.1 unnamed protein product [Paramecium primaurelia]